jgi:CDP-paratose 2-epimerase
VGVDNNMRRVFFGPAGDTLWNLQRLKSVTKRFTHAALDIRDRTAIEELFRTKRFDLIVHCAAQPSHDKAREIPLLDFEVNALGTVNLLEATRQHSPEAVFVFLSTNKVYGEAPNEIPLAELEKRYDYARAEDFAGVAETCRIDQTLHSLFGASKAAADIVAQEYGRYFNMKVGIFRGGCLTGPSHSGVELHGFLSYLVKVTLSGGRYSVFGYKGKQVRDNIHTHDVVRAIEEFAADPRPGEVYNLGGRPREQHFHAGSYRADRADDRTEARLALRGRSAQGRPHLLYLESWKIPESLSELENYARPGHHPRRDHSVATSAVGAGHGEMSTGVIPVIEKAIVSLIEQDFSASA